MLMRIAFLASVVTSSGLAALSHHARAADVVIVNRESEAYEVAIVLTSPGFKTERDGIIRRHDERMFRVASNLSATHAWDLVVWKRTNSGMDWRFSTAYRIPSRPAEFSDTMLIFGIEPSEDRVSPLYAAPGPGPEPGPDDPGFIRPIEPWSRNVNNGGNSENRPNSPIRLGVNAYKCDEGIHIQAVTPGSAATRGVDQASGQPVQLESGDHILTVNGMTPRDIPEFQSLIQTSPRTIQLKVLDRRTRRILELTANLW